MWPKHKTVSVCIATYNGSAYIEEQLHSILPQLADDDEVVVVDDCSLDATVGLVRAIGDKRIKIHVNPQNQGVLRTFNRAIELAIGEVIFLCDQDDVWFPNKVARFMSIFDAKPEIIVALSDAEVIDAVGNVINCSFFRSRGGFRSGIINNIVKNGYLGCAMAFRRSLTEYILPFPADIPMHDMWIGCLGQYYGEVYFIDSPLIGYRRHASNASPAKRQSLVRMLIWRWKLTKNLLYRIATNRFNT